MSGGFFSRIWRRNRHAHRRAPVAHRCGHALCRCAGHPRGHLADSFAAMGQARDCLRQHSPDHPVAGHVRLSAASALARRPRRAHRNRRADCAYALLPILRNTYAGIRGIDPSIIEVARALGLTDWQLLTKVELPLSASFILAGLRTATVTCVGIATIAAAVGAGGLGELIFRGVASVDNRLVLAGAIPAALLALAADAVLGLIERWYKVPGK